MTTFPVFGGCLCGNVRYKITGAAHCIVHCHCSKCRRIYASLVGTGAIIEKKFVTIDKGEKNLTAYEDSRVKRQFCSTCGCSLFYYSNSLQNMMFYYPATLDEGVHPGHPEGTEHHIFVGSKAEWEHFEDNLPRHDGSVGLAVLMNDHQQA